MNIVIWIIVFLVGLVGAGNGARGAGDGVDHPCSSAAPGCAVPAPSWPRITTNGVDGVIVPEQHVPELAPWGASGPIEGVWTPSAGDIAPLEAQIEDYAKTSDSGAGNPPPTTLIDYKRQYAGILEGGERKIFVNGFCWTDGDSWTSQTYIVMDGGDCYFAAVFNVDRQRFERFRFNGNA